MLGCTRLLFLRFALLLNVLFITVYINSNTLVGDTKHSAGVVLAEVVKANIPVKNGVVHLIQRPLMVVDTTINQFLEVSPVKRSRIIQLGD